MKTKFLAILFFALLLGACNKDDESSPEPEIPAEEKLLLNVENGISSEITFALQYNTNKTLSSITFSNAFFIEFEYNGNQVSSMESVVQGKLVNFRFAHDQNGNLTSFSKDGIKTLVNYDPTTRTYSYLDSDNDEISIKMTTEGDMEQFSIYDTQSQQTESFALQYDDSNIGPMANSNIVSLYLNIFFADSFIGVLFYPLSKKPVKSLSSSQAALIFQNEYDNQNFISEQQTIDYDGNEIIHIYNYFALEN